MRKRLEYILTIVFLCLFLTATALLYRKSGSCRCKLTCSSIEVSMEDSLKFVKPEEVKTLITRNCGACIGKQLDSLELHRIESFLQSKSAIGRCQVWATEDGVMHVTVSQRAPSVRFSREDGSGFYADRTGYIFPLHKTYVADVPVVRGGFPVKLPASYKGEAPTEESREWLKEVISLLDYLEGHPDWQKRISALYSDERGEITLALNEYGEKILIGLPVRLPEKFNRMEKYCSYIRPANAGDPYRSVDVKYNKQIVCRRDI